MDNLENNYIKTIQNKLYTNDKEFEENENYWFE